MQCETLSKHLRDKLARGQQITITVEYSCLDKQQQQDISTLRRRHDEGLVELRGTEAMIKEYPKVKLICAHGPMNIEFSRQMAQYENYYVDTAYTVTLAGAIELLIDILGPKRILFGSDMPIASPYIRIAQLIAADINDDELESILFKNATRLYAL